MNATEDGKNYDQDVARREWLTEQVNLLLKCEDADNVKFFSSRLAGSPLRFEGFADRLMEQLGDIDNGPECFVVQCLLALSQNDAEKAQRIYDQYLHRGIVEFAEQCVQGAMA